MPRTLFIAILAFLPTVIIAADFEDAMSAYEQQDYRRAYVLLPQQEGAHAGVRTRTLGQLRQPARQSGRQDGLRGQRRLW